MPHQQTSASDPSLPSRLDKWLWCARFFKTRSLAAAAVAGGKVYVNGNRAKSSYEPRIGDRLEITRGTDHYEIEIRALANRRGPATVAQMLYEETAASREARLREAEMRKAAAMLAPRTPGRPDKRTRRLIHRFKQGTESQ